MGTGILCMALVMLALVLLVIAVIISKERIGVFFLIAISIILIYTSESILNKRDAGRPAYPKVLVTGEKYEVVDIYEKYIIVKSTTDNGKLKFIGPLDFGTRTVNTGIYVKTAEESLVKIQ